LIKSSEQADKLTSVYDSVYFTAENAENAENFDFIFFLIF